MEIDVRSLRNGENVEVIEQSTDLSFYGKRHFDFSMLRITSSKLEKHTSKRNYRI